MQSLETNDAIEARIVALKGKLKAREGRKEFKENCAAIRAETETLEKRLPVASEGKSVDL